MNIPEYVSKYDPADQFNVLLRYYEQVKYAWDNEFSIKKINTKKIKSIILTGLGGSAISGDLMVNFLGDELKIPFTVNRNYNAPSYLNKNTFLIVSSYSGNTEETISVFKEALKKDVKIVCITTGGKIEKIALKKKIPVVKLPAGFQPRYALCLSFFSLLKVLQKTGFIKNHDSIVQSVVTLLKEKGKIYSAENNIAYNYALQVNGYIPVIYSAADLTSAVGYRLKCQFNENSKLHAFHNIFPENNHNEIIGWETFNENQLRAKIINIIDKRYHPQVKKRFGFVSGLLKQNNIEVLNLESREKNFKVRLLDLIYLGDWITYYTAVLRGYDPVEIHYINLLKEHLSS